MQKKRVNIQRDVESRNKIAQQRPRPVRERKTEPVMESKDEPQEETPSQAPDPPGSDPAGDKAKKGGRKTAGDV